MGMVKILIYKHKMETNRAKLTDPTHALINLSAFLLDVNQEYTKVLYKATTTWANGTCILYYIVIQAGNRFWPAYTRQC